MIILDLGHVKFLSKTKKKGYGSHEELESKHKKESPVNVNQKLNLEQAYNILSTQGDTSSNGTGVGERRSSGGKKLKSSSISSGSNERKPRKTKGI